MYKRSIKLNRTYLLPFTYGVKYFNSDEIEQGSGTLMVINEDGYVLTCKHVAELFIQADRLNEEYPELLKELKEDREGTIKKYNLDDNTVVLTTIILTITYNKAAITFHDTLDLALIHFENVKFDCEYYPIFSRSLVEIGQSVCKLGFAFPEYDCFEYSKKDKAIVLKENPVTNFPLFPLDGIVTRYEENESGFEMSTPGIKGQSGGPIFSPDGIVYGIQSMTQVFDMNAELDIKVKRGIKIRSERYNPFIGLGIGVSSTEICKFLDENKVKYRSVE